MITKKTEYAIRALWELANNPDQLATANGIAEKQAIPPKYLPQIISELSRAGLLSSVRGYGGGVRLNRSPRDINLLNVVEAMQGKLTMFECQLCDCECGIGDNCDLKDIYIRAQSALEAVFRETLLSDVRFKRARGKNAK